MSNLEDVEAYARFFASAQPKNEKAKALQQSYLTWYNNRSWYEQNVAISDATLANAKRTHANYLTVNEEKLSFTPREMSEEDKVFIKDLQEQGSFANAVKKDAQKVEDRITGNNLSWNDKLVRYGIIALGSVVALSVISSTVMPMLTVSALLGKKRQ